MIGFPSSCKKLGEIKIDEVKDSIADLLLEGEKVIAAFKTLYEEDTVAFTDKRVIVCTPSGVMGKKTDFTSLPYSKIQGFSVETAGAFDSDAEMVLSFLGLGHVKFGFEGHADVAMLARTIGGFVL